MAASTLGLVSPVCAASAPARDSSKLSSRSTFGTSLVQFSPVRRSVGTANRVVVVRANLSEDQPATGKKVLASFLAAGAALSIAGQALAGNPIDFAKNKADEVVSSAQNATSNLPGLPKIELPNAGALQNAGNAAQGAFKDAQGRIDGIFGKDKPFAKGRVASTNGGTGSAFGDAKARIANFPGKNPFAENLTKTTEEYNAAIPSATGENSGSALSAREFLGQDSTRVDAATKRVQKLGDDIKSKAGNALDEAKSFVGSAQNATPDLPSIPTPKLPSLPNPLEGVSNNMQDAKEKVGNKATNAVEGVKNIVGSDVTGNVASKVDDVKGNVSANASKISSSTPGDVADGAKNLVGSAQDAAKDATSNFPSLPNLLGSDMRGNVASKVDDVKGDVSAKASDITNSTPGDVADGAKNLVGSAQDAAKDASSSFPSLPNPFEGLTKNLQGRTNDVKNNVASKADDVKGDVSSKVFDVTSKTPGDIVDGAKNLVGSVSDAVDGGKNLVN